MITALEEDKLPAALESDFHGMLEKVRTWGTDEEEDSLDIPDHILKDLPVATIPPPKGGGQHAVPIVPENDTVKKYIHIYTGRRKKSFTEALSRSGRYRRMMQGALKRAGLPQELFWLVMAESEFKTHAYSRSGAAGLWQFMPFTARRYGLEVSYWVDERYHPEKATVAAVRYLSELYQYFQDWHLAMAAYNRGESGIARDLKFTRSADFMTLSDRKGAPRETRNYVPKYMACVLIGENPDNYGITPQYESPEPYDAVTLKRDLDLAIAAKAAGTDLKTIKRLNPHIKAWCTPKNRQEFKLRLPRGSIKRFWKHMANVANWNPGPKIVRYRIRRGDYLGKIARRYRTTIRAIMRQNNIKNARLIRAGQTLKIRPGKSFYGRRSKKKKKRR